MSGVVDTPEIAFLFAPSVVSLFLNSIDKGHEGVTSMS